MPVRGQVNCQAGVYRENQAFPATLSKQSLPAALVAVSTGLLSSFGKQGR